MSPACNVSTVLAAAVMHRSCKLAASQVLCCSDCVYNSIVPGSLDLAEEIIAAGSQSNGITSVAQRGPVTTAYADQCAPIQALITPPTWWHGMPWRRTVTIQTSTNHQSRACIALGSYPLCGSNAELWCAMQVLWQPDSGHGR